ncbi:MAG: cytochrome c [Chromatiales bacterium]|jgi:nitric oxide reductase subunit C
MTDTPWWAKEGVWAKVAIFVTAFMALVLIFLTFDTLARISAGGERVPSYAVINHRVSYEFDDERNAQVPVIGEEAPLFGKKLTEDEARELVTHGKLTIQAKNCMNCHTLLGNGAYFAPDLTKSWLDPAWGSEARRERQMQRFLLSPPVRSPGFHDSDRQMPDLGITEEEARSIIAYLKWMSAIDTNGFPYNFPQIGDGDES